MPRRMSKGTCNLCGGDFTKTTMTRHLKSCPKGTDVTQTSSKGRKTEPVRGFHLLVEGRYAPEYWMHLQVPAGMKLKKLDDFLRATWLECCGHLSAFRIDGRSYAVICMDGFDERNMNHAMEKVLYPDIKFTHEYDFGTTTELALRVISEEEFMVPAKSIKVLARNSPPEFHCMNCQSPATQVCVECSWEGEGEGLLCEKCTAKHECDEEIFLPMVNSPRVGMCGYEGEDSW